MKTIEEKCAEFNRMFLDELPDWQSRFQFLVDMGQSAPIFDKLEFSPEDRITGCLSTTFFKVKIIHGKLSVSGWSNSAIMLGVIEMFRQLFDEVSQEDVTRGDYTISFIDELIKNMTPSRADAVGQIVQKIR